MNQSDVPAKLAIPFADGAGGSYIRSIPVPSQPGGAASLTDGFPPPNFVPVAAGGIPPFGEDMNGILNNVSAWARWVSAGGPVIYDATFQATWGGYPKGCIVQSVTTFGTFWISTVDNNVTNPDTGGAGWVTMSSLLTPTRWVHLVDVTAVAGQSRVNFTGIPQTYSDLYVYANYVGTPSFNVILSTSTNNGASWSDDTYPAASLSLTSLSGVGGSAPPDPRCAVITGYVLPAGLAKSAEPVTNVGGNASSAAYAAPGPINAISLHATAPTGPFTGVEKFSLYAR